MCIRDRVSTQSSWLKASSTIWREKQIHTTSCGRLSKSLEIRKYTTQNPRTVRQSQILDEQVEDLKKFEEHLTKMRQHVDNLRLVLLGLSQDYSEAKEAILEQIESDGSDTLRHLANIESLISYFEADYQLKESTVDSFRFELEESTSLYLITRWKHDTLTLAMKTLGFL
eukprot:TRINITY_DN3156_c0_g1_i10.p1 TRINITY_DN3156_c0_g1~~TRINITY_DN3156_c0_g1_i10.p1  ORF type:complete len:170 (+),score=9.90 TRINITY_DN3156_c0_g1_i10:64-573(+)